jgi:hypothetical protein
MLAQDIRETLELQRRRKNLERARQSDLAHPQVGRVASQPEEVLNLTGRRLTEGPNLALPMPVKCITASPRRSVPLRRGLDQSRRRVP